MTDVVQGDMDYVLRLARQAADDGDWADFLALVRPEHVLALSARADRAEADLARSRADARRMAEFAEQQLAKRNEAEDRLAVLRAEVGQAVAVARTTSHPGHAGPCTSGLDHLPPEPRT